MLGNSPCCIRWREICTSHICMIIMNLSMHASILIYRTEYWSLIYLQGHYLGKNVHPVYFSKGFLILRQSAVTSTRATDEWRSNNYWNFNKKMHNRYHIRTPYLYIIHIAFNALNIQQYLRSEKTV